MTTGSNNQQERLTDEEYQRRIDSDPSVKRLSARTVREREKAGLLPDERNPKGAGRKKMPPTASAPSLTVRVPEALADDIRKLIGMYRQQPGYISDQIRELAEELDYYMLHNE